jgi:hypothetical protein
MKTYFPFIFLLVAIIFFRPAFSATLIESQESGAGIQKTWVDGTQLRVETEDSAQYMLMDFSQHKLYLVHPENSQVMDMSKIVAGFGADSQDQLISRHTVLHLGKGPVIAGYQTEHYRINVNGEKCFDSFTSTQAVDDFALQAFIDGMKEMFPKNDLLMQKEDPCSKAEKILDYKQIGLPLKISKKNSGKTYVVIKLEKNASVPEGGFTVPQDFHIIDYGEMILRIMQQQVQ